MQIDAISLVIYYQVQKEFATIDFVVTPAIRSTRVAVSHVEILLAISSGSSSCGLV